MRLINRRSLVAALATISMLFLAALDATAQFLSATSRPPHRPRPQATTDVPGRLIADGLSGLFSQRSGRDRVGAAGWCGRVRARSEPNGYTLLYANTSVLAVNPALQERTCPTIPPPRRADRFVSNSPQLARGRTEGPYRSVQELVAGAKTIRAGQSSPQPASGRCRTYL